ncbi:MAG: hypothetical protein BBJ60_11030 [Desulfobacterales bacterium S7086C20]|nr:MAG: hypothetical protein BBJ60_11030 [Desulfobacterales bacterium S7086C20]
MKIRFMVSVFFVLLLSNAFSAPSDAEDHRGNPQDIFRPPQRIVSLVPAVTEELFLLGMGDSIVGVTVYCQRPPEAQVKEKVGTVIDANVEKIIELSPDLVIASPLSGRRQTRKLQRLAINVEVFDEAVDFKGLCENFLRLSRLVKKEEEGRKVIREAKRDLKSISESLGASSSPRVFVQIGANPLFTAKGESFINDLVERARGINIAKDATNGIFSREEVIERNPDIILIATMGIIAEKEKEVWLRYQEINAVNKGRIFTIDSNRVCSPTPVSFVDTVKELVELFHGEQ